MCFIHQRMHDSQPRRSNVFLKKHDTLDPESFPHSKTLVPDQYSLSARYQGNNPRYSEFTYQNRYWEWKSNIGSVLFALWQSKSWKCDITSIIHLYNPHLNIYRKTPESGTQDFLRESTVKIINIVIPLSHHVINGKGLTEVMQCISLYSPCRRPCGLQLRLCFSCILHHDN